MRFNDLLHLAAPGSLPWEGGFPGKAHGRPPASGFVVAAEMPDPALQFLRPISALTYPGQAPPGWVCSLFLPGIIAPWFPPPPGHWHTSPWANQRRALHALTSLMPMVSIIHCAPRRPKPVFFTIPLPFQCHSMPFQCHLLPFAALHAGPNSSSWPPGRSFHGAGRGSVVTRSVSQCLSRRRFSFSSLICIESNRSILRIWPMWSLFFV